MENIDLNSQIVEDTTGPAAPEIATTDENLIGANEMFQQTALPSLGRQIFSVIPVNGPTGAIFNVKQKSGLNDLELVRAEVEVYPSESISTGITQEAIQDIKARFGRKARNIIGTLLRGLANEQENTRTLEFLEANSLAESNLNLSDSINAESNLFEITQKVNELVLRANSKNMRTYEAYCVLPYQAGAAISALSSYVAPKEGKKEERGLFLAQVGQTKFFMNPDATSTKAYVGLTDSSNPSKSAAVFSPYIETIQESTNPDTGEVNMFVFNRFAITASPLNEASNEMMFKFDVII
jgi:hypothetical protein